MISMFIVGGVLAVGFAAAGIIAAISDRRRSIRVVHDSSRFAPQAAHAKLPWS